MLAAARSADINLALWWRPARARLAAEAKALAACGPLSLEAEARPDRLAASLARHLPIAVPALLADIRELARRFAAIAGQGAVRCRLEVMTERGCPRFHADHVGLRLLCTYLGPGTEWLPEGAVDRRALASGGWAAPGPGAWLIRRLPAFTVGILKGEAFPGNRGRGIVHRSAPASKTRPRLLLCLDEPGRF